MPKICAILQHTILHMMKQVHPIEYSIVISLSIEKYNDLFVKYFLTSVDNIYTVKLYCFYYQSTRRACLARRSKMNNKITKMELFVVWLVSIVVFGFTGYISITIAERFFSVLYPLLSGMF